MWLLLNWFLSVRSRLCAPLAEGPDLAKVRLFNNILANAEDPEIQRQWWTQHTPLANIPHPFRNCRTRTNGCVPSDPALVRCSSAEGANRASVGNATGTWPVCLQLLDTRAATAAGPERLAASPESSTARPLFYSFGMPSEIEPDSNATR